MKNDINLVANWSYPTNVKFGAGRIDELPQACVAAGITKPLLVTDKGLAALDVTSSTLDILEQAGLGRAIFADVDPNPNEANLNAGIAVFIENGHDGIIAFGGGSGLDLGKLVALMAGQNVSVWDLEDVGDWWTRADASKISPIIAVPTTAGTGSEVGRAGVLTNVDTQMKKIIFHPKILPVTVICDPELTVGMPNFITAGTGMDAFAHCLEAYCSPHYHPMSQGIAIEGLRLVKNNLLRAYKNGDDLVARAHMMSAAAMGATAFQKGLGAIHSLSHPIGAIYHKHHGTTNAVVMRQVLKFNRTAIEPRIIRATAYLGIDGGFNGLDAFIGELNNSMKIPANLTDFGIKDPDLDRMSDMALEDPSCGGNPIKMTKENTLALYEACM